MIYSIIPIEDIDLIDFSLIKQSSKSTVRKSIDGQQFFIKYDGETPGHHVTYTKYSKTQVLEIINGSEWVEDDSDLDI
jgi:hypothetical protein|tara:strand:- start:24 stop:257 length:234 start_codon:yes stop_codon:yes gene_type:complete